MKSETLQKFNDVKLFLFDLEGCIIPKNIVYNDDEIKKLIDDLKSYCKEYKALNVEFGIVTSSYSDIVNKLKSNKICYILNGSLDKVGLVDQLLKEKNLTYDEVFYIGDDLLDIPLLQKCKLSSSPKDGRREVKRVVTFVTNNESGSVIEEILEYIKQSRKK